MELPTEIKPKWREFLTGFSYGFRGGKYFLTNPGLWLYAVIPIGVTLILGCVTLYQIWSHGTDVAAYFWAQPELEKWYHYLLKGVWYVYNILCWLILTAFGLVASYAVGILVSIPFVDQLSVKVEEKLGILPHDDGGLKRLIGDILYGIAHTVLALLILLALNLLFFVFALIPVVGIFISTPLSIFTQAIFLSREMFDFSMSRRRFSFAHKFNYIRARLACSLGFGSSVILMSLIPGYNLLILPIAVTGGTLLFAEYEESTTALVGQDSGSL